MQAVQYLDLLEPRFVLKERCPGAHSLQGSFLQASSPSQRSVLCQHLGVRKLDLQEYLLGHLFPRHADWDLPLTFLDICRRTVALQWLCTWGAGAPASAECSPC